MFLVRLFLAGALPSLLLASVALAGARSTRSSHEDRNGKKRIFAYEATDEYTHATKNIDVVVESTPKEKLEEFSPENIPQFLEGRQTNASDFRHSEGNLEVLRHTAYDFPKESAVFFAGVGGVLLMEMMTQYEKNPMALAQQMESLENPVGHFSFFMFMYANRISMSFWPKLIKNPALWSYLGMTVGMLASDITSELLEPMRPCAQDLLKKSSEKKRIMPQSCSKAYKDLVLTDKLLDMAPSLTSMLISSWLAGTIQSKFMQTLTSEAVAQLSKQYLKWEVVNVLEFFAPGGAPTKLGALVLNLLQISLFVGIDHKLSPIVKKNWSNLSKGMGLAQSTRELTDDLLNMKAAGWSESSIPNDGKKCIEKEEKEVCYSGFPKKLYEFREKMAHWRQANMESVRLAHQSWNQKLSKLSALFDGSFDIYSHIINEIINSKQGKFSLVDEGDPYFGIKPLLRDGGQFPTAGFLDGALQAQMLQRERLKVGAKKISEELANYRKGTWFDSALTYLSLASEKQNQPLPPSLQKLARIGELWEAKNENEMFVIVKKFRDDPSQIADSDYEKLRVALALAGEENIFNLMTTPPEERSEEQNQLIAGCSLTWFMRERAKMIEGTRLFGELFESAFGFQKKQVAPIQEIYERIESEVGRPKPLQEPGRSYLRNFALSPQYSRYFELIDYPNNPGHYQLETPAEYFLHQMICGPDAESGDTLVEKSWMSYDQFIPPQIRSTDHSMDAFCRHEAFGVNRTMYSDMIVVRKQSGEKRSFKGVISYLKENIRTNVLDAKGNKNNLKPWWDKNVSPQIDSIFSHYADDYNKVVELFREIVRTKNSDNTNMGPIFNSPVWAIQQEARFYLLVLSELIKDAGVFDEEKEKLWGESQTSLWLSQDLKSYPGSKLPLFSILKFNGPFDLAGMSRMLPRVKPQLSNRGHAGELLAIRHYDYELINLSQLTSMLGTGEKGREHVNELYSASANKLGDLFGQIKALSSDPGVGGKFSQSQKLILEQCLEGLDSLQKELNSYHLIVSLLSRDAQGKVEDNKCHPSQNRVGKFSVDCSD